MHRRHIAVAGIALAACCTGCGAEEAPSAGAPGELDAEADGFSPPPPAAGMTRIVTPTVHDVQPGGDVMYCQYVLAPFDRDMDILSVGGYQSRMGHHIVAFASTADVPVGTSRLCQGEDNFSGAFLGGVGGEAGTGNVLPEGVAFRLPKGSGIMLNTHYLNTWAEPMDGEGVIDIEFAEVDPSRRIASFFVNIDMSFTIPPRSDAAIDATCVIPKEMQFIAFSNHLHDFGSHIFTEVTRADTGVVETIVHDPEWTYEMQFAPQYATWGIGAPFVLRPGDRLRTRCAWNNPSDETVTYPREMCVGSGFYLTDTPEAPVCFGGNWVDGSSEPPLLEGPPCVEAGAAGNEAGVGRHCTEGGGECGAGASICLADYTRGTWGNFCTRLCSEDGDCGTGASCTSSAEGASTQVCIPEACVGTALPEG
jgi:hypothetical protein